MIPKHLLSETALHSRLLAEWQWLLGDSVVEILAVTATGDALLLLDTAEVGLLDVSAGELRVVAADEDDLQLRLADAKNLDELLLPSLVQALQSGLGALPPDHCFSPLVPATLGGKYHPTNYRVAAVRDHLNGFGKLQKQIVPLEPGTEIVPTAPKQL